MPTRGSEAAGTPAARYRPERRKALLVLAHGAGAGQRHPFMVAVGQGLATRGIEVVTFDFPYMQQRKSVPDKAPVLERAFRDAIDDARGATAGPLFIGGKSMGGRIATHLAAQQYEGLSGVVALGYPLHPPGRADQLRTAHLPAIRVPLLIVQGERDTFGTPGELEPVLRDLPATVTLHVVERGDHSLNTRTKNQAAVFEGVMTAVAEWILSNA